MTDSLIGQTIGKYKIIKALGRGGMAEVYQAYQENLDRIVAIKIMHAFLATEQDFLKRFQREAKAMAALRHPNIVSIHDFDVYGNNVYYLVMEYVGGGSLKARLQELSERQERLPLAHSVKIALELTNALAYAHSRGMVHRDIKPANIMLDESGRAILTDFGIVKLMGGQSMQYTATGALIGTPAYMSPEQALGQAGDERCDLYSLGVLLFQMTTGQLPYAADTPLAVVMKHVNDPTPLPVSFNPEVPTSLQEIILKAMAKDPDDRYQTADEMAEGLRNVDLTGAAVKVAPTPPETTVAATPDDVTATLPEKTAVLSTAASTTAVMDAVTDTDEQTAEAMEPTVVQAPLSGKKRVRWLVAGAVLLLLIAAAGWLVLADREPEPEPTAAVIAAVPTETEPPPPTNTPTNAPKVTATKLAGTAPTNTAVAAAGVVDVAANTSTDTPTPTATPSPTPSNTPTPDATATFLAECVTAVELVEAHPYQNNPYNSAPVSTSFTMYWTLRNSGACPWAADLLWQYHAGELFGYDKTPIPVGVPLAADEEVTLTANFVAPNQAGAYEATWQLVSQDGQPFAEPLTFEIRTYIPATATPRPTNTPEVIPTEETALNWYWDVSGCEYVGDEWRCALNIVPYGGGGGPYTVWVFDQDQPAEYRGPGPFTHFIKARRCAPYIHNIKIQDDATGNSFNVDIYIDPNSYFTGGCVQP